MSAGDSIDWTLVDRYLAGDCSADERRAVAERLAADPAYARELEAARTIRAAGQDPVPEWDLRAVWDGVVRKTWHVDVKQRLTPPVLSPTLAACQPDRTRGGGRQLWRRRMGGGAPRQWVAIAAALVLIIGLGVTLGVVRYERGKAVPVGRAYATAAGQRMNVTLADGTQMTLAPASRARVASDREIELDGEGYFRVVHNALHPFAVRTRGAIVRDVGTTFDVRAYPEDVRAWIAVADGVVAIGTRASCRIASTRPCEIRANMGDVATVAAGTVTVAHGADVTALTSWARGLLMFTDVPLQDVVIELRRWYGADVEIADQQLAERRVTIAFGKEPVSDAVTFVAATAGAVVERHGTTIVLRVASPRK